MKRLFSFFLICAFLVLTMNICVFAENDNIIPTAESTMQSGSAWGSKYGGSVSYIGATLNGDSNNTVLCFTREQGKSQSWHSPTLNLVKYLEDDTKKNGGGTYKIQFDVAGVNDSDTVSMGVKFRADKKSSFTTEVSSDESEFRTILGNISIDESNAWHHFSCSFSCDNSDFAEMTSMLFCFDAFKDTTTKVYLDNFTITRISNEQNGITTGTSSALGDKIASTKSENNTSSKTANVNVSITEGENLLSDETAKFEVSNISASGWSKMGTTNISVDSNGVEGKCLLASGIENGWSSPTLDISQYILKEGKYSFGMFVQMEIDDDSSHEVALFVRGQKENSFIKQHGNNYYTDGVKFSLISGLWVYVCCEIDVTAEDIEKKGAKNTWEVALSGIPDNIQTIRIDNAELILGTKDKLSQEGTKSASQQNTSVNQAIAQKRGSNQQKVVFDESFFTTVRIAGVVTLVLIVVVIFIKIRKAKK